MSPIVLSAVGLTCKAFLNSGLATITVNGLPILMDALHDDKRNNGHGIVTVSNHISTLDDPVSWGVLPARNYCDSRMTRWTLGAADIMFTNPVLSYFFRKGQVLETFRGNGIDQASVHTAIEKLGKGDWIHLYGEGKVNQPKTYRKDAKGRAILPKFKWGVGHIISSATNVPTVIPMWITGFDTLMPEGRRFPFNYFPRIGARLSVTFGNPIPPEEVRKAVEHSHTQVISDLDVRIRTNVTALVHRSVVDLGRSISGDSLGGSSS